MVRPELLQRCLGSHCHGADLRVDFSSKMILQRTAILPLNGVGGGGGMLVMELCCNMTLDKCPLSLKTLTAREQIIID
jgi:hypothetical protein